MSRIKLLAVGALSVFALAGCDAIYFLESTQQHSTCAREDTDNFLDSHGLDIYEKASRSFRSNSFEPSEVDVQFFGQDPRLTGDATLSSRSEVMVETNVGIDDASADILLPDNEEGTFTGRLSVRNRDTGAQATGTVNALMFGDQDYYLLRGFFNGTVREVTIPETEEGSEVLDVQPGTYAGGTYFAEVLGFGFVDEGEEDERDVYKLILKLGPDFGSLTSAAEAGTLTADAYADLNLAAAGVPEDLIGHDFGITDEDSVSVIVPRESCRRYVPELEI